MDELDFYKTLYEREFSRRQELDKLINIPITIISLIGGILYFLFKNFSFENCSFLSFLFTLFIFITFLIIITSTIFIALSFNNLFKGHSYKELPYPKELKLYYDKIIEFNKMSEKKQDFNNYLIEKYIDYSDIYMRINDKRSLNLYRAKTAIIISYFLTFICIIFYVTKTYIV